MEMTIKKSEEINNGITYSTFDVMLNSKNLLITVNNFDKKVKITHTQNSTVKRKYKSFSNIDIALSAYSNESIISILTYSKYFLCK
jgi:hypothetical protein